MNNNYLPIIFIHKGNNDYLHYTLSCAKHFNPENRIILLGDATNKQYKQIGIEHFMYANYEGQESQIFDILFKYIAGEHHRKNIAEWLVRFWFKRWFHIFYFIQSQQIYKFWTFDSDTLILCHLESLVSRFAEYDCTDRCNGWCMNGLINNLEVVRGYIEKINELFQDRQFLEEREKEYKIHPDWAFTEMAAYLAYKDTASIKAKRLNTIIDGETFDDCICQQHDMEMAGRIKKIYWRDGQCYVKHLPSQKMIKLNSLNMSWVPTSLIKEILEKATASELDRKIIDRLNLKKINLIVFPDWKDDEELLLKQLEFILKEIITHSQREYINLLIEHSHISEEEANLLLSSVLMEIMMQENIEVNDDEPAIMLMDNLSEEEWSELSTLLTARIILEKENEEIAKFRGSKVSSISLKK